MEEKIVYNKTREDLDVPRNDENEAGVIYKTGVTRMLLTGFITGGIIFGFIAYVISSGIWPLEGFGYFSSSGVWPAIITGFGFGSSLGGLITGSYSLKIIYDQNKKGKQVNRH